MTELVALAVGAMGMRLQEVYSLTVEELSPLLEAWARHDEERRRERWEQVRLLAYFQLLPYQKKGRKLKPHDLFPLPWEKDERKAEAPSDADIERMARRFGDG